MDYTSQRSTTAQTGRKKISYIDKLERFKFISPRCLRVPNIRGCTVGEATFSPKCNKVDFLQLEHDLWPVRCQTWGEKRNSKSTDSALSTAVPDVVHVYDIIERQEQFKNASRFSCDYPSTTIVTLLGQTKDNTRVAVHVHGVCTTCYFKKSEIEANYNITRASDLKNYILDNVKNDNNGAPLTHYGIAIFSTTKRNIYFYESQMASFWKVQLKNWKHMLKVTNALSKAQSYESHITPTARFLLDNKFTSFGWYNISSTEAFWRPLEKHATSCDIEVDCTCSALSINHSIDTWPSYKVVSFDIECLSCGDNEFAFPNAELTEDIVIQISAILTDVTTGQIEHCYLFSLGSCSLDDREIKVLQCDSEYELLLAFFTFLKQYSPEFLTGYNIVNFDLPFLIDRMNKIYNTNLDGYGKLEQYGRCQTWNMASNAFQKNSKAVISGIIIIDMYSVAQAKLQLSSYKLGSVSVYLFGEDKEDLAYKDIPQLYHTGAAERGRIGSYCVQDSMLVIKMFFKFMPHIEAAEVAKLAHITVYNVIFGGQQIRVLHCLLEKAEKYDYVLPHLKYNSTELDQEKYKGATVVEPMSGFYVNPITVFDFASLYPSIIQAHNLCLTTLTTNKNALENLTPDRDYQEFKVNGMNLFFVKSHIKQSLLSELLSAWLNLRKEIRKAMTQVENEDMKNILDKRQAAIKVTCNSVYGFTGASHGLLPCLEVAATVTTIGRQMLDKTKGFIESRWGSDLHRLIADFPVISNYLERNKEYFVKIVYGDTDSVFVESSGVSATGMKTIGSDVADIITASLFTKPIKLECEKVFHKLLLIKKKKYIGLIDSKLMMKGVELVRRNNCPFITRTTRELVDCVFFNPSVAEIASKMSKMTQPLQRIDDIDYGFMPFIDILKTAVKYINQCTDINDFTFTTVLSKAPDMYDNAKLPHLEVYNKKVARGEQLPQVKDRIEFVIIEGESSLISDMAEDPSYAQKNNLKINTDYYMTRLLKVVSSTFLVLFNNDEKHTEKCLKLFIPKVFTLPEDNSDIFFSFTCPPEKIHLSHLEKMFQTPCISFHTPAECLQ